MKLQTDIKEKNEFIEELMIKDLGDNKLISSDKLIHNKTKFKLKVSDLIKRLDDIVMSASTLMFDILLLKEL